MFIGNVRDSNKEMKEYANTGKKFSIAFIK